MPKADMPSTTSRRALLAGAALIAPASLLPAIAAAAGQDHDPHPAWFAEWRACLHWCNTADVGSRDLVEFPQYHRALALERLIGTTPARTLAGVAAQLRVITHWQVDQGSGLAESEEAGLAHAIATVERLAGGARHG